MPSHVTPSHDIPYHFTRSHLIPSFLSSRCVIILQEGLTPPSIPSRTRWNHLTPSAQTARSPGCLPRHTSGDGKQTPNVMFEFISYQDAAARSTDRGRGGGSEILSWLRARFNRRRYVGGGMPMPSDTHAYLACVSLRASGVLFVRAHQNMTNHTRHISRPRSERSYYNTIIQINKILRSFAADAASSHVDHQPRPMNTECV